MAVAQTPPDVSLRLGRNAFSSWERKRLSRLTEQDSWAERVRSPSRRRYSMQRLWM